MKFSILMPVLNGSAFIEAAISSICAQNDSDWELVVIDGGSTDGSGDIAAGFAARDPRIRLISGPDQGMYDALFKGIAQTDGDWIGWLNSDDLYTPWALAAVRRYSAGHDCDWVTGLPGCWDAEGRLRSVRPAGEYDQRKIAAGWHHDRLLGYLQQESMFFSRRLIGRLAPDNVAQIRNMRLAGDFLMWRFFARHAALEVIPSVLGGFRRHGANMSGAQADAYRQEVMSTDPFTLPSIAAAPLALVWRMRTAWRLAKLADAADRELMSQISENRR